MFQVGNQYGKMSKRGKALDKEMRERIKQLANGLIDSIDIDTLTSNQRINMLKSPTLFIAKGIKYQRRGN